MTNSKGIGICVGRPPTLSLRWGGDRRAGRGDGYSNENRWGVGSKVQGYSGPGRVTQK